MKCLRIGRFICCFVLLSILSAGPSWAVGKNERTMGLILGDPIGLTLKVPMEENTFLNIHAGIWTWHFWHDQNYDTPFFSMDYAWCLPLNKSRHTFYAGLGLAGFFRDNPKDDSKSDAVVAIRMPLGVEFFTTEKLSLSFELAPIYQIAPAYTYKRIFELNGGLIITHSF